MTVAMMYYISVMIGFKLDCTGSAGACGGVVVVVVQSGAPFSVLCGISFLAQAASQTNLLLIINYMSLTVIRILCTLIVSSITPSTFDDSCSECLAMDKHRPKVIVQAIRITDTDSNANLRM
ncbi:hypothetical protein FRB97_007153 [Tulasnella sp. 331]|nr:hypothetical protein FRB97_007153 [Tulasnella sp. 331]